MGNIKAVLRLDLAFSVVPLVGGLFVLGVFFYLFGPAWVPREQLTMLPVHVQSSRYVVEKRQCGYRGPIRCDGDRYYELKASHRTDNRSYTLRIMIEDGRWRFS